MDYKNNRHVEPFSSKNDIYEDEDDDEEYDEYDEGDVAEFCDEEYETFVPEREESTVNRRPLIRPIQWSKINFSPKEDIQKPNKTSTWWDTARPVDAQIVNGVINYAALLPPPSVRPVEQKQRRKRSNTTQSKKPVNRPTNGDKKPSGTQPSASNRAFASVKMCVSVSRATKCFRPECKFAHSFAELKECGFGNRCRKIVLTRGSPNIYKNNPADTICAFKHPRETESNYISRNFSTSIRQN